MAERGKAPSEVNADVSAFSFKMEAEKRKHFIGEAYQLLQYLIVGDVESRQAYRDQLVDEIDLFTQKGHLSGYGRDGGMQTTISLLVMPEGTDSLGEPMEGTEQLRILFPVADSFAYSEEDFDALGEPTEMFTEWTTLSEGVPKTIRWVIREDSMIRYTSSRDAGVQTDEMDDLSALERLEGRSLTAKSEVLSKIINDFVFFKKTPQRRVVRSKKLPGDLAQYM